MTQPLLDGYGGVAGTSQSEVAGNGDVLAATQRSPRHASLVVPQAQTASAGSHVAVPSGGAGSGNLPFTGYDAGLVGAGGLALVVVGLTIRAIARARFLRAKVS